MVFNKSNIMLLLFVFLILLSIVNIGLYIDSADDGQNNQISLDNPDTPSQGVASLTILPTTGEVNDGN